LEKLFDPTVSEGSLLKFLNLCIVQSSAGISFDQTHHIRSNILAEYFAGVDTKSIKMPYTFPLESSFECRLFEAIPLTGIDLTNATKYFGFAFGHIVGGLMHISTISHPDLSYSVMQFSGCLACLNLPIFDALHMTICYLFHHSSKKMKSTAAALHTHWSCGFAEYLSSDFDDGLTSFADADFATDLCSRHSFSSHFQLLNGVIVSWGCKKQPATSLHSCGAELHSIYRAGFKCDTLQGFLASISLPLDSPSILFEDNQGTIKLLRTYRFTPVLIWFPMKTCFSLSVFCFILF